MSVQWRAALRCRSGTLDVDTNLLVVHADMKSNMHTTYAFFVDSEADPKELKALVNEVLEENRSKKKGKTELRLKALAGKAASTVCIRLSHAVVVSGCPSVGMSHESGVVLHARMGLFWHMCIDILTAKLAIMVSMMLRSGPQQASMVSISRMQIKEAAETFVETMKSEGKSKGRDDSKPTAKAALGGHEDNILLAIDPEGNMVFAFDPDASAEEIATTLAEHITHYGRQNACERLSSAGAPYCNPRMVAPVFEAAGCFVGLPSHLLLGASNVNACLPADGSGVHAAAWKGTKAEKGRVA